jgi:uncharacterized protein DUF4157
MTWRKADRSRQPPPPVKPALGAVQHPRETALSPAAVDARPSHHAPPIVHDVLRAPGQPLDEATRAFMEPRFGHDFGQVRVHTHVRAAEAAQAVGARAYTIGADVVFAAGQYQPAGAAGRRLLAHELGHVVQQQRAPAVGGGASLKIGAPDDHAEREADRIAGLLVDHGGGYPSRTPLASAAPSPPMLQRQPAKTSVQVGGTSTELTQGKGGSGAIVYDYPARARKAPVNDTPGDAFDITLPLLVYPPATLKPPTVDVFVFFHGMRAGYGEGPAQGSEPIALWTHLQEAVAGTDRLGIAPQAPKTWRQRQTWIDDPGNKGKKKKGPLVWEASTAQWHEALTRVGFDGLIKIALERLTRDLKLGTPLVPGTIHVAGHSAGGQGIIEATEREGGAKALADKVQDLTLQDAGYGGSWEQVVDWLLEGTPTKTVRVLISEAEASDTRAVLTGSFNVAAINRSIAKKKKSDTFEAAEVNVPAAKDQKPRPGGFVLESQLVVKNKKTGATQGTMVAFLAPGGGHYETATATMGAAAAAGPTTTTDFLGEARPGQYRVVSAAAPVFDDRDLRKAVKQAPPGRGGRGKDLVLARDTMVEVTALELETPRGAAPRYIAKIKVSGVEGWVPLARLAPAKKP